MRFYLASASPRRLALLLDAGWRPQVILAPTIEERLPGEPPEAMVQRLARAKALAAIRALTHDDPPGIVLGADTAVVLEDAVLGKPSDESEARDMLRRLAGRRHRVISGVALIRSDTRRETGGVETTHVEFHPVSAAAITRYAAGGSPLDKAGAYGIQDLDDTWIKRTEGLRSNVIGLPIERIDAWLRELGGVG